MAISRSIFFPGKREFPGNRKLLYKCVKSFHFDAKMIVFGEQWMFSAILFGFGGQFSDFCEKIVLTQDVSEIPAKNLFSIIALKNWPKMLYFCNLCTNKYFFWSDLLKLQENSPYFSKKVPQNFPNFPGNSEKYFPGNGKRKFGISREFPGREFPGCHP